MEIRKIRRAQRNLYTFLVSKMLTSLGFGVFNFGISLYILSITGSALSFATNIMFNVLPRALAAPLAGYVADHFPKKRIVILSMSGITLSVGVLIIYTLIFGISVPAIYTITTIFSIIGAFNGVAFSSSIPNLVGKERLQKALSFNQISYSIGGIGGPAIGGMLFGFISMKVFLFVMMIAYFIALCLEVTMDFTLFEVKLKKQKESMAKSMKEGFQYLRTKPLVQTLLMATLWINFFSSAVSVGLVFVLVQKLSIPSSHVGFIQGAGAIGMLIASLYLSVRNLKKPFMFIRRSSFLMCTIIVCLSIPLFLSLNGVHTFVFYSVMMLFFSAMSIGANTPMGVVIQQSIDQEHRGRVFGMMETLSVGTGPLGSLLFGALFDAVDPKVIFLCAGIFLFCLLLWLLRLSKLTTADKLVQIPH
ncbi:MFS transporter [Bacillus sp. FJAT-49736]|uniref:MFS transporter n=1 Tax=Bacillus sp. FJAT-49736 TaxID=2833582 RepID=UPI001BC9CDAB|nr:MFS transporter [Bacillus sp. FJAT-49736]MBS4172895.1 MFS transporter [Bacillus sp. FJAT-49736]